jgi:diguanylate cyclase (GGDEF)-like protein
MGIASYMSRDDMAAAVAALDQALYVHEQWCNHVYCSLICRLAPDERDLSDSPHRRCPFGQWYYAQQNSSLGRHPGFVAVETEHEQMHRIAAHILMTSHAGEEFLLWAAGTDLETGRDAIERLREGIAATGIDVGDGRVLQVTASFGVTLLDPDVPVEESIARADQALYGAKAAGRNQTRTWDPSLA